MSKSFIALLLLLASSLAGACGGSDSSGPTPSASNAAPSPSHTVEPSATPAPQSPAEPPGRDLIDLARRFRGLPADAPRLARATPFPYQIGDHEQFAVIDLETPKVTAVAATLRLITDHAYFFVEDGRSYSEAALQRIGADFESQVYPKVTAAFGREWTPGVDSDPRITIVHAGLSGAGGYYDGSDEYPRAVVANSNEREALYLDASSLSSSATAYNALVAHELQHMVHWNADPDEEAWVNEGLSQAAAELVGGGSNWLESFLTSPDTQLNFWPELGETGVHYAASELFFGYLLDRFGGRDHARELLRIQADGIAGVNAYLAPFNTSFTDVFADWTVANYLDEESGPYSHRGVDARVQTVTTIGQPGEGDGSVHQFAADYLEIESPPGGGVFTFDGSDDTSIGVPQRDVPPSAGSGQAFWWSGRGDGIDSRLTREFDLTGLHRATLRFSTWFDTERSWDYAYVEASADGGRSWRTLPGRNTTDYNPLDLAYGPGYTGHSDGWLDEEVDLSQFAGSKVLLRFEYITDDATSLTGFAVDDISIPELGFADSADSDGGWQGEGFQRIDGPMRQQFIVQKIVRGQPPQVTRIPLDASNRAQITIDGPATIVVSGVTDGTAETAAYHWTLAAP